MNDPPVVDAALIAKDSSEVKKASLVEVPKIETPQDDKFQVVNEEEQKADEKSISEVPLQNGKAEYKEDLSEQLNTPSIIAASSLPPSSPVILHTNG